MNSREGILCIGEILWDSLPSGLYLGGAPLNVCYHLNQLNIRASIASRVGSDRLGKEAIRRIEMKGIPGEQIQQDDRYETGFVCVEISESGDPDYEIVNPVAWDFIQLTDSLQRAAETCWGLVFGSLAQRNSESRTTIQKLLELDIYKIMDMNLRAPFVDTEVIYNSLMVADLVKMNEEELNQLKDWYGLSGETTRAVEELVKKFDCSQICITRGANGAMIYQDGKWYKHKGFPVMAKDAVGAGDAFLAALLQGLYMKREMHETLMFANATGAFVASRAGATPEYTHKNVEEMMEEYQPSDG